MRSGGSSGFSRAWTRALGKLSAPHGAVWSLDGPRLGASAIVLTYCLVVVLASGAIQSSGDLGLEPGPCGHDVCVAWVMPAGHGWQDGARPGMRVVTLNGEYARAAISLHPLREAELLSPDGQSLVADVTAETITRSWARVPLWLAGALFALLGAVVLVRRPDAAVARLFGLFAGFTAVALAVSPAAGGPHVGWSLVVQFLSLLGVAASLPAFAAAFVGDWRGSRTALRYFWLAGGILSIGYLTSVFIRPSFYSAVRIGFAVYFVGGILSALVVLARKALARGSRHSARDARLALSGIACGTLPFVGLSLIPLYAVHKDLVPARLTAVLWGVIPLTFAYAILRHQVLGIRRLVHRGMVHGITTVVTLAVMCLLVVAVDSRVDGILRATNAAWVTAALLALGALLFHVLSRGVRSLVDRFFYPGGVDSGTLLAAMRDDLVRSAQVREGGASMVTRLRDSLRLEAVILFLGTNAETLRVTASAGSRADETITFVRPRLLETDFGANGLSEMRWNSDVLLIARLGTGSPALRLLALGPKESGEHFLRGERRLVQPVAPIRAPAVRETSRPS